MTETILIGVAWPYANGWLHLGHIAGCYLPADIFARYHRMKGNQVLMVSGSDQHGTPVTLRAEHEGTTVQAVVDKYHQSFLESWDQLGITFDLFTTTGTENHRATVHELIEHYNENGYIYPDVMQVAYSPDFKRFLPDRYVEGICPYCQNPRARGDQCDSCGHTLDPIQLGSPVYLNEGQAYPVEIRDAQHLFFKLSAFETPLIDWVDQQNHWRLNVRNFTRAYLNEGLRDRAITRDLEWGIPVPIDGFEDKRIYVWFEAVVGYLSASREWAQRIGDPKAWEIFWKDPNARIYNFIGKDNIPFHTIIWPAMLMAYGQYRLPYDVPANEFLTLEGKQLSTSRNWAVWVPEYLAQFPADPLRYNLAANMPESGDADFSWAEYVRRNNDELVATYGNLVNRVLTLINRHFDGKVPVSTKSGTEDAELITKTEFALEKVANSIEECRFREAVQGWMGLAHETNRYLEVKAPWQQVKKDLESAATTLYTALCAISGLRIMTYPIIPFSAQKLHEMMGFKGRVQDGEWDLKMPVPGQELGKVEVLFSKLDLSIIEEQTGKLG